MVAPILVTGGTGTLGRLVVARLLSAGHEVRVMSRHPEPAGEAPRGRRWAVADLLTGEGVEAAVGSSGAIAHCATSSNGKKDVEATRRLTEAARAAGCPHLLYISIVGCDEVPFGYFKGKLAAERLVEESGVPYTILRATQFHDFVRGLLAATAKLPLMPVPGFAYQPIEAGEVADRMAELMAGGPAGRVPDMGGPEILEATDLARRYLRATGRRRAVVPVRLPGRTFRAYRRGGHLTADHAVGRVGFDQYLAARAESVPVG
ncbi:SDR family oxidoreductase [Streptomyces sp. URMC 123]|uniref:SDR family oxidoreductase n=1 Tax=Streptomyces sp. URMC 123 TaxID=3423403 RepID=UPI003F1D16D1